MAKKLDEFLGESKWMTPLEYVDWLMWSETFSAKIREYGLGKYNVLTKTLNQIIQFRGWLDLVTLDDLESVHGIGPKTARFFLLHSRPDQNLAVLDVHILRWMREQLGVATPKQTPTGKKYRELEAIFLTEAAQRGTTAAQLDLDIWKQYSQK